MRLGRTSLSNTDILQLLSYKYDIIKEYLYREMLQDEYGTRSNSEYSNSPFQRIVKEYLFFCT